MLQQSKSAHYSSLFIFVAGISAVGLLIPRHNGWMLLFAYFTSFFGYFWFTKTKISWTALLAVGISARLLLFFSMPSLSDDVYRFIWDGLLFASGTSPYQELPSALINIGINGIDQELFDKLNSPEYYSVYPPFNQYLFWLTSLSDNWLVQTNILRTVLLIGDVVSVFALRALLQDHAKKNMLLSLFFLNPLLILEVVGNLHFEGLVITCLLLGCAFLQRGKFIPSGIAFGLAIATKLVPIIFLPALLFKKWFKTGLAISVIATLIFILTFIPFLSGETFSGIQSSLDLYFRSFEFNASVYFLAREVGFWMVGYNMIHIIGPSLSILTFLSIMGTVFWGVHKKWDLEKICLFSLTLYLLFATTVHPWYILPLMTLGILSGYYYPLVWSMMIFVTYFGYTENGFELSPIWIVLEYVIVLSAFLIETFKKSYVSNL